MTQDQKKNIYIYISNYWKIGTFFYKQVKLFTYKMRKCVIAVTYETSQSLTCLTVKQTNYYNNYSNVVSNYLLCEIGIYTQSHPFVHLDNQLVTAVSTNYTYLSFDLQSNKILLNLSHLFFTSFLFFLSVFSLLGYFL